MLLDDVHSCLSALAKQNICPQEIRLKRDDYLKLALALAQLTAYPQNDVLSEKVIAVNGPLGATRFVMEN